MKRRALEMPDRAGEGAGAKGRPAGNAGTFVRSATTPAVAVALLLWAVAESIHPAGAWIDAPGDGWLAIAIAAAVLVAAGVSGTAGLAFTALAGAVLAFAEIETTIAARALIVVAVATLCYAVWTGRATIEGRPPGWLLAVGAVMIPTGLWASTHVKTSIQAAALGALLIAYVLYAFVRRLRGVEVGADDTAPEAAEAGFAGFLVGASPLFAVAGFGLLARVL